MTLPKIGVILSSTRPNRFADRPAAWIMDLAARRGDLALEIVDLRDYPLVFFDAPMSPAHAPIEDEVAQNWSKRISGLDGYIFVVAEYNHSIPAALKNALDYTYKEFARKPAAYVGYGGVGAARAIEQLRLISIEQQLAPTRSGVHIGMEPFLGILQQGKTLNDFGYLVDSANAMLDDLAWWTAALKAGREDVEIVKAA